MGTSVLSVPVSSTSTSSTATNHEGVRASRCCGLGPGSPPDHLGQHPVRRHHLLQTRRRCPSHLLRPPHLLRPLHHHLCRLLPHCLQRTRLLRRHSPYLHQRSEREGCR